MFSRARFDAVKSAVASACDRAGRNPADITIVGVTKTLQVDSIRAAIAGGLYIFGENRVQEADPKIAALQHSSPKPQWHLIGHLQTNKAKNAVEMFDLIQSVDSLRLAEKLQRHAEAADRQIEILLQVNTSGEGTKSGVTPSEAVGLAQEIAGLENLKLTGLMTIGAFVEDQEVIRRGFRILREKFAEIAALNLEEVRMQHLSMGMTDDFELAIEEGATMVRIGRAIFGSRPA